MATTPTLQELYLPIQAEMERVQSVIRGLWDDLLRLVEEKPASWPADGGKLMRPALCLLCAGAAGGEPLGRFVPLAAAMELLHVAALAHDDVIDGAALRRGVSSLNARWSDKAAVLGGDYIVSRAMSMVTAYDACPLIDIAIESVRRMTEGELAVLHRAPEQLTPDDCIELARKKTASLFAASCCVSAPLIPSAPRAAFYAFGEAFGVAFQLVDDLLDLLQGEEMLGKPSCGDITEGKSTLPIWLMRRAMAPGELERLDAMTGTPLTAEDRAWVAAMLERTGAREESEAAARHYIDAACEALAGLPDGRYKDSLLGLAEFVLVRGW